MVTASGLGINVGLGDVEARVDGHHVGMSGPGFGLIKKCVVSVVQRGL